MRNDYEVTRFEAIEPNLIEVRGTAFCMEDLFEFVGRKDFICTFVFRASSQAHREYGRSITAEILYSDRQRDALMRGDIASIEKPGIAKLTCLVPTLAQKQHDELKYGGVSISEIEAIAFIPVRNQVKVNDDGTKEVPGVFYVEVNTDGVDANVLFMNLIMRKRKSGFGLIQYEKERFVGTYLGMNGGRIDRRLLKQFGFDAQDVAANREVAYHNLVTRKRRGMLSQTEQATLGDLCAIRGIERATLLLREVVESKLSKASAEESRIAVNGIAESIKNFEPHVFINGKTPIYWDLEGYLHIAMRHVKEMQVGRFRKEKTPFPYRADDLETLIDKVLGLIEHEIHTHYSQPPPIRNFTREGRVAVYFNGDYYTVRIDPLGRLVTVHAHGDHDMQRPTKGAARTAT